MVNELVSVVVPAYNAQEYVKRCLDSLIGQTYKCIEILIVDDGSKDATGAICDMYADQDDRVRVFHVENGGVSRARNIGLENARGEYVMFVDSDDYVAFDYVEKHYQAIRSAQADLAVTGYTICYPDKREEKRIPPEYTGIYSRQELGQVFSWLYRNYFLSSPWNKIYRRKKIAGEFPTDMALGEDLRFNLNYIQQLSRICISGECCYYYMCDEVKDSLTKRVNKGNIQSEQSNYHEIVKVSRQLKAPEDPEIAKLYSESIIAMLFGLARKQLPSKERMEVIDMICGDELTVEAMKTVKTDQWKSEALRVLLAKRMRRPVALILALVHFL